MTARATDSLFADRYRVERRIGAGGMGTVYRALDEQTRQRSDQRDPDIARGSGATPSEVRPLCIGDAGVGSASDRDIE